MHGRTYSAEDVAAIILHRLRLSAEQEFNASLGPVVLTVPAHFGVAERAATARAAEMAGLNVVRMLAEPCTVPKLAATATCRFTLQQAQE